MLLGLIPHVRTSRLPVGNDEQEALPRPSAISIRQELQYFDMGESANLDAKLIIPTNSESYHNRNI